MKLIEVLSSYQGKKYDDPGEFGNISSPVEVGEMYFFNYIATKPQRLKWYDQFPMTYVMTVFADGFLGANLHYLNPDYRDGVARGLINKVSARLPKKTLHRYFFTNIGDIFIIPPSADEWASVAELVTENFVNKYGRKVELQKVWDSI